MEEGNALPLSPDARRFVDELDAMCLAAGEGIVEILNRETNVMYAGAALPEELPDGGFGLVWLQQFDQRFPGHESHDARTIGVIKWGFGQAEDVAIEGDDRREGFHGDAEMGDAGTARRWGSHGAVRRRGEAGERCGACKADGTSIT
jgi:hypothetical protein